jgi:predicted permease
MLLSLLLRGEVLEVVLGDIEEEFAAHVLPLRGARFARGWFWRQALGSARSVLFARRRGRPLPPGRPERRASKRSRGRNVVAGLHHDLRYAYRSLVKHPGVSSLAVVTLALGIGATTSIFSLANTLVFSPIPGVRDMERQAEIVVAEWNENGYRPRWVMPDNYREIMEGLPAWDGIAGYSRPSVHVAGGGATPQRLGAESVMASYFDVLGVVPRAGRLFQGSDDVPGAPPVAVISDRLWTRLFHRTEDLVGITVKLNGVQHAVIGVVPPGFHGTERFGNTDVWFPGSMNAHIHHFPGLTASQSRARYYQFVGRLADGATFEEGQAQLTAAMRALTEGETDAAERFREADARVFPGLGINDYARERLSQTLRMLMGVVVLVLLIACANVTNLLVFQGIRRQGERAVRRALGASDARVLREQLTESVVLALMGGAVGVLLFGGMRAVEHVQLDLRVLAFTVGVSVLVGIVFGTVPALMGIRRGFAAAFKDFSITEARRRPFVRAGFAVLQLAASVTLLVGALLFLGTLRNLNRVDLGFDPDGVTAFYVSPGDQGYSLDQMMAYHTSLLDRVRSLPGVQSASLSEYAPFAYYMVDNVYPAGEPEEAMVEVHKNGVTPGYFRTLGIQLLGGRVFTEGEAFTTGGDYPVVLSEALAARLFGQASALGGELRTRRRYDGSVDSFRVVGVVRNTTLNSLREDDRMMLYWPLSGVRSSLGRAALLVKSQQAPAAVTASVTDVAEALDSSLPLYGVAGLQERVEATLSEEWLFARTLALLAAVAVVLASVGLYGLVAFGVAERTREFGIRVALGADQQRILKLVMRQAGLLALLGVGVGLAGAVGLGRIVEGRLFGVEPVNVIVYVTAALALALVALMASYRPARAATQVDPVAALRYD